MQRFLTCLWPNGKNQGKPLEFRHGLRSGCQTRFKAPSSDQGQGLMLGSCRGLDLRHGPWTRVHACSVDLCSRMIRVVKVRQDPWTGFMRDPWTTEVQARSMDMQA